MWENDTDIHVYVWATKYNMEVTVMNKYVSLDKRSKKAQREYHAKQRRTWGGLNPVTRSVPSGKTYNRKKEKQRLLRASGSCSVTTEAKRRSARNSEMDLRPIFLALQASLWVRNAAFLRN